MYRCKGLIYLASYYNFEDLLASKRNLKNTNERLSRTIKTKLQNINNHEVFFFEPHYYVLNDIFPNSTFSKPLYDRIDETDPTSYIRKLSEVLENGENIAIELKNAIVNYAALNNIKKRENNQKALEFAQKIYRHLNYTARSEVKYEDFIPYVIDLTIGQLNLYRLEYMLRTDEVTTNNFDSEKYELFINVYAKYLATLVGVEGESPALNDNIDSLILLYVCKGRKFMTCEKKWLNLIKEVGLHKRYIIPYSTSRLNCVKYYMQLKLCGKVKASDCQ